MSDKPTHELTADEAWSFISKHEFGRLAYHLLDEVHIAPINFCADGGAIYFRTAEGSKLLGVTMHPDVAFEVDDFAGEQAVSVVVRGTAETLEGSEKGRAEQLPLRPWVPTAKFNVVRIDVSEITGRRFDLSKPWEHMR